MCRVVVQTNGRFKMNKNKLSLIVLTMCAACGDFGGELTVAGNDEPVDDNVLETELIVEAPHYFWDEEDADAQFGQDGIATIDSEHPFRIVQINLDGNGEALESLEVRPLDDGGFPMMDWARPEFDEYDLLDGRADGVLLLDDEATTLEVRASGSIAFARFAFSSQEHDHAPDLRNGSGIETNIANGLRREGRWIPPAAVTAAANGQYLRYSGAPSRCSGGTLPGTRELANVLKYVFPGARSWGGYNCRANTANTSQLSVHASGRAIDLFVPLDRGSADNDLGDPIANYLIANAEALGIEYLVWDRSQWSAGRTSNKQRYYGGPHPHHDHLHIELSPTMANRTGKYYPPIIPGGTGGGGNTAPAGPSFVPLIGDFNGDGKEDLTTTSAKGLGGWEWNFYTEYGKAGGFTSAARRALTAKHMRNGDANKSYRQLVGDFNGDGRSDVASISPTGLGGWSNKIFMEYGTASGFSSKSLPALTPIHMRNGDASRDYRHLVGDFNGDGKDDIVTTSRNGGGGWADVFFVEYGTATGFSSQAKPAALPRHMRNGNSNMEYHHFVGDFNGDGKDDVASVSRNGAGSWNSRIFVEYGSATGFTSASRPASLPTHMRNGGAENDYRHMVGDFNGDGKDDIASVSRNGGGWWNNRVFVEYGKASGFTSTSHITSLPVHMRNGNANMDYRHLVGDFNGDGKDDIASVSRNGGGGWAEVMFVEYGKTSGFTTLARSASTPIHMRNGGNNNSYRHFVGDFNNDGFDDITTLSENGGGGWRTHLYTEFGKANGFTSSAPFAAVPQHIRNGTP